MKMYGLWLVVGVCYSLCRSDKINSVGEVSTEFQEVH